MHQNRKSIINNHSIKYVNNTAEINENCNCRNKDCSLDVINYIYYITYIIYISIYYIYYIYVKITAYFVKYFGVSPLSITLFCTIKLMHKYTINLTVIINATIGIKSITYLLKKLLTSKIID